MRILIVEDEILLANRLERLCKEILNERLSFIKVYNNLNDADDFINEHSIDLLFLDLNLQGQDGFQLLKLSMAGSFHTIVVSAYAERAIKAFEYGVLDFIPKPYTRKRLEAAINRMDNQSAGSKTSTTLYLSVKKNGRIELISVKDICYIKGAGNYSELYLIDKTVQLHDKSLNRLMDILPENYSRLHKSYIVPMDKVVSLNPISSSDYNVILSDGSALPISRKKVKELRYL